MNEFRASNGYTVEYGPDRHLRFGPLAAAPIFFHEEEELALREFFRAEEDERLGRWRWPENPDYVVIPRAHNVRVVSESTGVTLDAERGQYVTERGEPTVYGAASAYFHTHPEPKPWHDAKAGEVWVLTCDDEILGGAYVAGDHTFIAADHGLPMDSERIAAGRRIWPEAAA